MFQTDQHLNSLVRNKQFPLREPLRRNYQTCNSNPFGKKTLDLNFTQSLQKQIKIPLNLNKLYQKKSKNIIVHESSSANTSMCFQKPIFVMKTINKRAQSIDEQKLSKPMITNNNLQVSSIFCDSSDNSDFNELRRNYLQKYCKPKFNQIDRQPRFRIHSVNQDSIIPWIVDI
ncbi:unnamed protein product [Paramecium sonneborni]|uniref:Uncharacterized protein n=1 Tax=Paramecium sonneborni TaxID=65129 RepID=A0A8S1JU88_9CILI|nr:unnamed protein product [Paramecium sonneborni]